MLKNENEITDSSEKFLTSNDEPFVFVPEENIRAIEKVSNNWEIVKQQWDKIVRITTVR